MPAELYILRDDWSDDYVLPLKAAGGFFEDRAEGW